MQYKAFKIGWISKWISFYHRHGVIENEIDNPVRNLASAQNAHI